eukprot:4153493-Amphidinium_carterae.3
MKDMPLHTETRLQDRVHNGVPRHQLAATCVENSFSTGGKVHVKIGGTEALQILLLVTQADL